MLYFAIGPATPVCLRLISSLPSNCGQLHHQISWTASATTAQRAAGGRKMRLLPSPSLLVAPPCWNNGGSHDETFASLSLVAPPFEIETTREAPCLLLVPSPQPVRRKGGYVIVDGLALRQRYAGFANPGPGQESARGTVPACSSSSFYRSDRVYGRVVRGRFCDRRRAFSTTLHVTKTKYISPPSSRSHKNPTALCVATTDHRGCGW